MSTTPISTAGETQVSSAATVDTNLEVVVIPVSDVDRAKRFYETLGWRLDADFTKGDGWRVVQFTPPGSQCSIQFGKRLTAAAPGSVQGLYLVVSDIKAARADLIAHGAEVSDLFHLEGGLDVSGTKGREPGPDPQGRSYSSYASFRDPDGNGWLLQEVKTRLPGRGFGVDVVTMTDLLREAEQHHSSFEARAPKHHWSVFYGAYIVAREQGQTPEDAAKEAAHHVESARPMTSA